MGHFSKSERPLSLEAAAMALGLDRRSPRVWTYRGEYVEYWRQPDGREIVAGSRYEYWRRCCLPYGYWFDRHERIVLFNRRYTPTWQRTPDGVVTVADPHERVPWATETRFFNDDTRPSDNQLLMLLFGFGVRERVAA
jgi:hypothetical protein